VSRVQTCYSLNWCCQLLPCSDGEKSCLLVTNIWSFTVAATKKTCKAIIYMSVGIVSVSHVRATQCTRTPSLQDGWVFRIVRRLISCLHVAQYWHDKHFSLANQIKLLSKQGSNWQHKFRLSSLYPWHIMTSASCHK